MGSNIFNTTTGVQSDLKDPQFQRMIVNGVLWAGKQLEPIPLRSPDPARARQAGPRAYFRWDGRFLRDR
jgi:hypothetical protein